LIFALNNTGWFTKRKIINLIKNESDKPNKVLEVIDFVRSSGGIDYTKKIMQNFVNQAYDILDSFPESAHKNSLKNLVQFTIERTK
jgi:octaprenyl-diphosphate synthase